MDNPFLQNFIVRMLDKVPLSVVFWGSILTLAIILTLILRKVFSLRGE